jgi:hypothetical protein
MVKYIAIMFMALSLVACKDQPTRVEYKDKDVPVYITPAPPVVPRPDLAINHLTDKQKDDTGELAKAYAVSLKQVMQYACKLENIVDTYAKLAAQSPAPITPVAQAVSLYSVAPVQNPLVYGNTLNIDVTKDCNK